MGWLCICYGSMLHNIQHWRLRIDLCAADANGKRDSAVEWLCVCVIGLRKIVATKITDKSYERKYLNLLWLSSSNLHCSRFNWQFYTNTKEATQFTE